MARPEHSADAGPVKVEMLNGRPRGNGAWCGWRRDLAGQAVGGDVVVDARKDAPHAAVGFAGGGVEVAGESDLPAVDAAQPAC